MKKFALKLGTLALALVLFLGLCPMSFSSIASMAAENEIVYKGDTPEYTDPEYKDEDTGEFKVTPPMSVYWADASIDHPDDYTKIVGFTLSLKWTEPGYYGGWATTKENPMGILFTTQGKHEPSEYIIRFPGNTPVYDLSSKSVKNLIVGSSGMEGVIANQVSNAKTYKLELGDTAEITYEGTTAIFTEGDPIMTILEYAGGFEFYGIEWITGEPEERPEEPWDKVEVQNYFDVATVSDDKQNGNNYVDITIPKTDKESYPVVLWIHGGGYITGTRKSIQLVNTKDYLLAQGYAFVSVEYTLTEADTSTTPATYGKGGMPQMLNDVKAAVRFLRANAETYKLDTRFIAAMGESAGAGLALLMGTTNGSAQHEDLTMGNAEYSSDVQTIVSFCGPSVFSGYYKVLMSAYLGNFIKEDGTKYTDEEIDELSVLWSPTDQVNSDTPPMFLSYSKSDKTVPYYFYEEMIESAQMFMDEEDIKSVIYTGEDPYPWASGVGDPTINDHVSVDVFDNYTAYTTLAEWLNEQCDKVLSADPGIEPEPPIDNPQEPENSKTGLIIGLSVGGVVVVAGAVTAVIVIRRKKKDR